MVRWLLIVMGMALGCCLLTGCLRPTAKLTTAEVEAVAWYFEDLCHGIPRKPGEIDYVDGSEALGEIARWARGNVKDGESISHPRPVEVRIERWVVLEPGLREGAILVRDDGMLVLNERASESDRLLYADAARQENVDRLALASILLSHGRLDPGSGRGQQLLTTLRTARIALDLEAGGQLWEPPVEPATDTASSSMSTSETELTTSPSKPEASAAPVN